MLKRLGVDNLDSKIKSKPPEIKLLESYTNARKWLESFHNQLEALETELIGKYTTSLIKFGSAERDSLEEARRIQAIEKIDDFKQKHKTSVEKYTKIMSECHDLINKVDKQYQPIIEDIFIYGHGYMAAANKYGYTEYIYRLVEKELIKTRSQKSQRIS